MLHVLLVFAIEDGRIFVFVHVALRRLILLFELHLGKFLGFYFSSRRILFLLLHLPELFEDVLVVEESVREFLLKDISLQEAVNSILQNWLLQKLMDRWSGVGIFVQHHTDQVRHLRREVRGQWVVLSLTDSNSKLVQGGSIKWWLESSHFVEQHAK